LEVQCDPAANKVSIELRYLWNEQPTFAWHGQIRPVGEDAGQQHFNVTSQIDYGECFLAPGVALRVKVLEGVAMPYGMCGADPEMMISVWVGQRKWMSQYFLDGRCPDELVTRIELARDGYTTCTAADLEATETCRFKPASELPNQPDLVEYPVGERGPLPGTVVIDFAGDKTLCEGMVQRGETEAHLQSWSVDLPPNAKSWMFLDRPTEEMDFAKGQYKFSGVFSRQTFDIDNSGLARVVYGFHPDNHANDADIYFASPGPDFDKTWPDISEQALYQQSPYVFPMNSGTCGIRCGPADDPEEGQLTLRHPSGDETSVTFRFRYWHETPFTWNGATYFMARTLDADQRHLTVVLKPRSNGFDEVCLFRKVRDNY
jgi:hypothetical protein